MPQWGGCGIVLFMIVHCICMVLKQIQVRFCSNLYAYEVPLRLLGALEYRKRQNPEHVPTPAKALAKNL